MTLKWFPLRRLAHQVNGGTPGPDPSNWGGSVQWATPVDLARSDGGLLGQTDRTITKAGLKEGSREVPAGSLILSTRAPIGYVVRTESPAAFNQGCRGLIPNSSVDVRLLQFWIWSQSDQLKSRGSGSTFLELGSESLASMDIPLPELDEQRRIAEFLDDQVARIDQAIALRQEQMSLGELRYRSYVERELRSFPKRVPLRRLLADACVGIVIQPAALYVDETDPGVPALRGLDVKEGRIDKSNPVRISIAGNLANPRSQLKEGDVVVVRTGVSGTCAVVDAEVAGWNSIDVVIARPADGLMGGFLEIVLNHAVSQQQILAASSGSIQAHFGVGALKQLEVPLVDLPLQTGLTNRIRAERQRAARLRASMQSQVDLLHERKRSLITAAVTGEFDVRSALTRALAGVAS